MTEWQKVKGSQEEPPLELDTTSSEYFVYQRRNIQRINYTDETNGNVYELWEYEERKLTREEYVTLRANKLEEELTQTQIAMTELYESMVV